MIALRLPLLSTLSALLVTFSHGTGQAHAQAAESVYVEFNLDRCDIIKRVKETGSIVQRCPGLPGFPIFIAEDDLRFFVGYGPNGQKQKVFGQTLPPFNTIHNKIEFRVRRGGKSPFASILRYFTDPGDGQPKGQILVVTKIEGREACHIAYIDASKDPDPNAKARLAADTKAAGFRCERDEPEDLADKG
jgi:hypothetical protein